LEARRFSKKAARRGKFGNDANNLLGILQRNIERKSRTMNVSGKAYSLEKKKNVVHVMVKCL